MGQPVHISKEMGISHADFFRILPRIVRDREHEVDGQRVRIREDGRSVEILISDEKVRALGLVRLPYTIVELTFDGFDEAQRVEFMAEFDLQFFKGGG